MFKKVLIANRGEIAVRVMRACEELGIATVAVYSELDRDALHVKRADEAYLLGPGPAAEARKVIAQTIGYPVAVKAAGGGGGKGFRVALDEGQLEAAFEGASREGEKFFSDPTVYLERYLPDPRHVEVQVLADKHGNVIHLGERDCSIQRRHQKLIEESPAPEWIVDQAMRERIGQIGVEAARAVDYVGAGTVEGLLVLGGAATGESGRPQGEAEYFFLEMNTRVQVEHCATEMTTGVDIVKEGIRAAAGEPL